MADSVINVIKNTTENETGCIPNALVAKAMRMSMENKNVLLPSELPTSGTGFDSNLGGSLYYASGYYNAVKDNSDNIQYYVPQTTRVEVNGSIASGSVLTFNRNGSDVSLTWNASTGGVTISFDTSKYEPSSAEDTSKTYGKWVNKSKDTAGSTWPALYRMNLNLTSLSKKVIMQPQLLVQLYETAASGAYNAVSCSMMIQKTGDEKTGEEVVLSLYSNKPWAGIASILQTGSVISASEQKTQN